MTVRLVRNGDIPPGCVDGFCVNCKREVIADEKDPRCDDCGQTLHPASLPAGRLPSADAAPTDPEAAEKPRIRTIEGAGKTVTMRGTPAARAWSAATDRWLADAEREERDAEAEYRRAKERYDMARQEVHRVRQLRHLVQVDETAALPAPAPALSGGKPWSRKHPACVNCGTTRIKHAANGRCGTCATHWSKHGQERPVGEAAS